MAQLAIIVVLANTKSTDTLFFNNNLVHGAEPELFSKKGHGRVVGRQNVHSCTVTRAVKLQICVLSTTSIKVCVELACI